MKMALTKAAAVGNAAATKIIIITTIDKPSILFSVMLVITLL